MRFLLLIYAEEKAKANWTEAQWNTHIEAYNKFTQDLQRAGKMLGGEALLAADQATTVRFGMAGVTTSPGPFAETKEQLRGYYMIEEENLEEAVVWAAQVPDAKLGSVEVRPIMELGQ